MHLIHEPGHVPAMQLGPAQLFSHIGRQASVLFSLPGPDENHHAKRPAVRSDSFVEQPTPIGRGRSLNFSGLVCGSGS